MAKKVEITSLLRIMGIFVSKKWTDIDGYTTPMERFCHLIEVLSEEETELLFELVEKYHWMSYNDYHTALRQLLKELAKELLENKVTRLFVFPIMKPMDEDEIKSAKTVTYMLDAIKPSIDEMDNVELIKLSRFQDIDPDKLVLAENEFIVLVDDFIGTGKTLDKALATIRSNASTLGKFAILSIAIQKQTRTYLDSLGIPVFNSIFMSRGITDDNESPALEKKLEVMNKIENRIFKVGKYRNGYEKSEALITMIRTPNNSFPIFWKEVMTKGSLLKAPFQRD